jgi:hypothetical protein
MLRLERSNYAKTWINEEYSIFAHTNTTTVMATIVGESLPPLTNKYPLTAPALEAAAVEVLMATASPWPAPT